MIPTEKILMDNQMARDIINKKISELYCIRRGYNEKTFTLGKKYSVWANTHVSKRFSDSEPVVEYSIWILTDTTSFCAFDHDTCISDYFATSIKDIRKRKLNEIPWQK